MRNFRPLIALTVLVVVFGGCIGKKEAQKAPPTYVTPCIVLGDDILVKADGDKLDATIIKRPLAGAFVDDLLNAKARSAFDSYTLNCWWGKNVGERGDRYYCGGGYTAPELDANKTIVKYIAKNFKVGFDIEEQPPSTWTVDGKTYSEPGHFFLTVREIESSCMLA